MSDRRRSPLEKGIEMETCSNKKHLVGIAALLCMSLALVIMGERPGFTAPGALEPATVGRECKLDTPANPRVETRAGAKYIVSESVMWCLQAHRVEPAQTELLVDGVRHYPGKTEAFIAVPGQRYALRVAMPCSGTYPGISAMTLFWWDSFNYVYNTSGPVTLPC
jgi:hypothetical protein